MQPEHRALGILDDGDAADAGNGKGLRRFNGRASRMSNPAALESIMKDDLGTTGHAAREASAEVDPIEALERSDRRRSIVKALVGMTIGGALGYAGYPWVAGNRRGELVDGARSVWRQLRESPHGRRGGGGEAARSSRELPIVLDAEGREYECFLASLGLRHIQPMEMLRPHFKMRGTVRNALPPRETWSSIAPTLRVADELREKLGARLVTIASAYRSPEYNAMCPGAAAQSYHMRNMALDLVFDCAPQKVVEAAVALRSGGLFAGGIGRYPGFTHVDTRGRNADW
jgi:hypothetical protein